MRDWLTAFLPASFRGVPFHVDIEEMAGARRLAINPIAYAEHSVIEDMGKDPDTWSLTAYVVGDLADRAALALIAAMSKPGAGRIVLPMLGARQARVTGWGASRAKYRAGFVAIDISLIEEGFAARASFAGAVASIIAAAMDAFSVAAGNRLAQIAATASAQDAAALAESAAVAADRAEMLSPVLLSGSDAAEDAAQAVAIMRDAVADPSGFAAPMMSAWRSIAMAADPAVAFSAVQAEIEGINSKSAIGALERATLVAAACVAAVRATYPSRADAIAARSAIAQMTDAALVGFGEDYGDSGFLWLSTAGGDAALEISRSIASLAPRVRVETGVSLPATALAYSIYGDAARAGEIVMRNRIATPALMPTAFEVDAP